MKKIISVFLVVFMFISTLTACGNADKKNKADKETQDPAVAQSEVDKIIAEAQTMTLEELAKKAIEESNGKTFYGLGNSSRGKTALPLFIEYLQSIDSNYSMEFEWQQPKNNKIFDQLTADSLKDKGTFSMTLIQDGNQIETKMVQTGILKPFIPQEWAEANATTVEDYKGWLTLQTLNKVWMVNNTGEKTFHNVWDFVAEGEHGLFMDIDSEIVGKNFLYMLTKEDYSKILKEAYDKLDANQKAYIDPVLEEVAPDAEMFNLGENGKYALAWIKLWVGSYSEQTDDGPISNILVDQSATDQFGLLVYSKLRSIEESSTVSVNNITIAAYQDDFEGFGGYGYNHYLFITNNSPLPWTACAFNAYMTLTEEGFSAWGKDIGGYSGNPKVAADTEATFNHSKGGYEDGKNVFDSKNDRGYDWWVNDGHLILEDPEYCASVAYTVGTWIETLDHYTAE